jgi:hypothetical protein
MSDMIKDVCRQPVESDGVEFLSDSVHGEIIKENAEYSGVRVTFVAMIQNARLPMQIDIGFGDVIYSTETIIDYPTMFDFEMPRLKGYPKETVIAEKFEAMVKLGQLNSRMKDFFDIYILARQFDFDGEVLGHAIQKTFANRNTELDAEPFIFSPAFIADAGKHIQWIAFIRKSKLTGTANAFSDIVSEIRVFLSPVDDQLGARVRAIDIVPQNRNSAGPFPFTALGSDLVSDSFANDFSFELGEGQQDVQRQTSHRMVCIELLCDRDERDAVFIEGLHDSRKVQQRST